MNYILQDIFGEHSEILIYDILSNIEDNKETPISELAKLTGLSKPTIYKNISILVDAGVVVERELPNTTTYRLANNAITRRIEEAIVEHNLYRTRLLEKKEENEQQ